jgi:glucose/arabinose dehydrogenase
MSVLILSGTIGEAWSQGSVPEERRITHREQSLTRYQPFSADEMWKRIPIPPSPALSPEEALESFEVAPGFRVECVAAEPLVEDPVFFEFDPDGRIWVVEFQGWMRDIDGTGESDPICKVVVLEDRDGDTFMDKSTVFLDGLRMPRTVSFVKGGVLVAEPPNLWYCRDTDGDLVCDSKVRVGDWGIPGNPEHTDNGLMHGIDNWMYNAKSSLRHRFVDGELIADETIFRGQWCISQDDYGRLYYGYESSSLHADH